MSLPITVSEKEGKVACLEHFLNQAEDEFGKNNFWVSEICLGAAKSINTMLVMDNILGYSYGNPYSDRLELLDLKISKHNTEKRIEKLMKK